MTNMSTENAGFRIRLTILGRPAWYLPKPSAGMWYTRNRDEAKTYKRESSATRVVDAYPTDEVWATAVVEPAS